MAKGNMLLGHARGKVGDLVFSRSNGQQVTRARAAVVKNPQTEKQMIQRILLNTVAQAYSRMSGICDHSFEGVQQGQKSMSAFLHKNLNLLREKIAAELAAGGELNNVVSFSPIGTNVLGVNDYIIATGSLPSVEVSYPTENWRAAQIAVSGNTYGDVISSLNLQRGDQLTFIQIVGNKVSNLDFKYVRVILDPRDAEDNEMPLSTAFVANNAIASPNPRNEGAFTEVSFAGGQLLFSTTTGGIMVDAAAVIVSRKKADGTWARSNTTLVENSLNASFSGYSMQECLDMFTAGGYDAVNNLYLNNAGDGRTAQAGTSSTIAAQTRSGANVSLASIIDIEGVPYAKSTTGVMYHIRCGMETSDNLNYGRFLYNKSGADALAQANGGAVTQENSGVITNPENAWIVIRNGYAREQWLNNYVTISFEKGSESAAWLEANGVNPELFYESNGDDLP